jgi:hypothetical protein
VVGVLMLRPISLDHEHLVVTNEVNDVRPDGLLSAKPVAELVSSYTSPDDEFRWR